MALYKAGAMSRWTSGLSGERPGSSSEDPTSRQVWPTDSRKPVIDCERRDLWRGKNGIVWSDAYCEYPSNDPRMKEVYTLAELQKRETMPNGMVWKDYNYGWRDDFDPAHLDKIEWWLANRWEVGDYYNCHGLRVARTWIPEEVEAFEAGREERTHGATQEGGIPTDLGTIWIGFNYGS